MIRHRLRLVASLGIAVGFFAASALAQDRATPDTPPTPAKDEATKLPRKLDADPGPAQIEEAVRHGVELLLQMQESMDPDKPKAEWPYEGVYRVREEARNVIPIGYRVGGTCIAATCLLTAPGYGEDPARREAVARATRFVLDASAHPLMNPDYDSSYDVRGWGYTYRLLFLLRLKAAKAIPDGLGDEVEKAIKWDIEAIQQTEIPQVGGWNYARPGKKSDVSPPSPFMTAPTLEALFNARAQGYEVKEDVVARAIETLLKARGPTGSFVYAGATREGRAPEPVPGAVGRMLASETTLYSCGKSSLLHIRAALDAFITHWDWLDKRRAQNGTHIPPYNIAPYYFYYAHYYAARAIELLPERERPEYRRRLYRLIFSVQLDDGSWNDRVFARSRNFGTAMCVMALLMPSADPPAHWGSPQGRVELPKQPATGD